MKKLKLNLVMIALIIGVTGAFAFKPASHKTTARGGGDYWFNPAVTVYHDQNETADEQAATGCTGSGAVCEKGFTQSQLNNQNDPSQGVQAGSTPDQIIYQD